MAYMIDDLLVQILLKLPVKSLLRFRCVSKHFYQLIESPEFISMHLNNNEKKQESILVERKIQMENSTSVVSFRSATIESLSLVSLDLEEFSFPDLHFYFYEHEIVGSDRNGLVCIASYHWGTYLFNPALREIKLVPRSPFGVPVGYILVGYNCGFGFDPNTNGYKVVHLVEFISDIDEDDEEPHYADSTMAYRVELYDLKNDSWREIDFELPILWRGSGWQLSFNGVCHWVVKKDEHAILCFNLTTETFGFMEFPDEIIATHINTALLVTNESLAVVDFENWMPDESQLFSIWVMKEYGRKESWVKQYVIGPMRIACPLSFLKDEKLLVESSHGRMAICTLETNETQELDVVGIPETLGAVIYKESLVSVASLFKCLN